MSLKEGGTALTEGSRKLRGSLGIGTVRGGKAGVLPGFLTACLYLLVPGERAVAVEGLCSLWEACKGGWDFQEAFLQRGGEESLGLPPAALPGPLPQRGPGNPPPPQCVAL